MKTEYEYQTNWTPRRTRSRKQNFGVWTIIGFLIVGILIGYVAGLWQQAIQKTSIEQVQE